MLPLLPAALLLLSAPAAEQAPADAKPAGRILNRVAAMVNGEPITLRELQERGGPDWQKVEAMPAGPDRERAAARTLKAAFDGAVAERLLQAQVKELGLEVTDAEVDAQIQAIKERNRIPDDAVFERALAAEGLTREAFRARLRRDMESMRVIDVRTQGKVKVSDDDLLNYYRQHPAEFASGIEVHVRHVFLQLPAGASAADEARVREKGEKVLERLRAGEDFAKMAREVSQGPSAADGGDLGWLRRGVVQPEVERVAFSLETGKVSELVRTRAGFQILKVEGRRGGEPRPFDDVKNDIREKLTYDQRDALRLQYVAELRKDAVIELRIPELKEP